MDRVHANRAEPRRFDRLRLGQRRRRLRVACAAEPYKSSVDGIGGWSCETKLFAVDGHTHLTLFAEWMGMTAKLQRNTLMPIARTRQRMSSAKQPMPPNT